MIKKGETYGHKINSEWRVTRACNGEVYAIPKAKYWTVFSSFLDDPDKWERKISIDNTSIDALCHKLQKYICVDGQIESDGSAEIIISLDDLASDVYRDFPREQFKVEMEKDQYGQDLYIRIKNK